MPNDNTPTESNAEARRELEATIARLMRGERPSREERREACEQMDRLREETFRKHGLLDFAVPTIRELRENPRTAL